MTEAGVTGQTPTSRLKPRPIGWKPCVVGQASEFISQHEQIQEIIAITPTMSTTDNICTQPFDANPDVTGLGVGPLPIRT